MQARLRRLAKNPATSKFFTKERITRKVLTKFYRRKYPPDPWPLENDMIVCITIIMA